jgi:hypothetical protein
MIAKNMLAGIGAVTVAVILYQFLIPLIDVDGVVDEGSYRGLEIGSHKVDVSAVLTNGYSRFNKLKLVGYAGDDDKFQPLFYGPKNSPIMDADVWYLRYPGAHQETVSLHFQNGLLVKIKYIRAIMDP